MTHDVTHWWVVRIERPMVMLGVVVVAGNVSGGVTPSPFS